MYIFVSLVKSVSIITCPLWFCINNLLNNYQKGEHLISMQTNEKPRRISTYIAAICTGIANGLFGAGGGMLAVVVLERLCKLKSEDAHATALMVMLPLSIVSIVVYLIRGAIQFDFVPIVTLGVLPGSLLGAKLLGKMRSVWIDRLFAVLMLAAGVRLLL